MTDNYQLVLEQSRTYFAEKDFTDIAVKGAASYQEYPPLSIRQILILFLGELYIVNWPEGYVFSWKEQKEPPVSTSLLILHYLCRADGSSTGEEWLSFKELWGGKSFDAAFKKRSLEPISNFFHFRPHLFSGAVNKLGGSVFPRYKNSFFLFAFPRLPLLCTLHPGDEEISTRSNILYDSAANNYLETEDLAVLGEILAEKLINAANNINSK